MPSRRHEKNLCGESLKKLCTVKILRDGFGGDSGVTDRPPDLGYWMGYKIAEAYYQKAEDKTQAVADIIQMKDADAFLEASGYAKKFD